MDPLLHSVDMGVISFPSLAIGWFSVKLDNMGSVSVFTLRVSGSLRRYSFWLRVDIVNGLAWLGFLSLVLGSVVFRPSSCCWVWLPGVSGLSAWGFGFLLCHIVLFSVHGFFFLALLFLFLF